MTAKSRTTRWAVAGLLIILGFSVAWRWHTIGPIPGLGAIEGTIIRSGEPEPLDCDEAAYAYMGRRVVRGDVLYRDLTENKPPLGYWLYTLAVAIGGANELTIRVMAIPYVLLTIGLVWWIALKLGGPGAACLAAGVFAVADTDPYLFGNGSNMEHFLNLFSVASLALIVGAGEGARHRRGLILAAGACLAMATLVKQVAVTHGLVSAVFLMVPTQGSTRTIGARLGDIAAIGLGFAIPWIVAIGVLIVPGAGRSAYDDIVRFAAAIVRDLPPPLNAPPKLVRWVVGNADPGGRLPWPFGKTTYLVWWGAGLWPFWLASLPATARLVGESDRRRVLLGAWTVSAWFQVFLPGQFWPHYYLLPVPGAAIAIALWSIDLSRSLRTRPIRSVVLGFGLLAAIGWSGWIQLRDYLGTTPAEITTRYKGGRQWVDLRAIGRDLAKRSKVWSHPTLFVWGWQSPLYLYSGLDSPSRHFFANELLKAHANDDHPLVRPWIDEIMHDLQARPPALVMAGDVPFPALKRFLSARYLPSTLHMNTPDGRGLWVDREHYAAFHAGLARRFQ